MTQDTELQIFERKTIIEFILLFEFSLSSVTRMLM